jgi:hypothetical protein
VPENQLELPEEDETRAGYTNRGIGTRFGHHHPAASQPSTRSTLDMLQMVRQTQGRTNAPANCNHFFPLSYCTDGAGRHPTDAQGQIGIGSSRGAPAGPQMRWPGPDGGNNWLPPYAARPRHPDASSGAAAHGVRAQQLNLFINVRRQPP